MAGILPDRYGGVGLVLPCFALLCSVVPPWRDLALPTLAQIDRRTDGRVDDGANVSVVPWESCGSLFYLLAAGGRGRLDPLGSLCSGEGKSLSLSPSAHLFCL